MIDLLIESSFYIVTGALLVGIPLWYVRRVKRRGERSREAYTRMRRLGLREPVTLHPVVNADRCIGSEACVRACPEGEILGVIDGKATLVSPSRCIGHGACASSCPVQAITLVFGTEERGVDLPMLRPNFETNIPGVFIAGELGGMGLIRNAVTQGREAIGYIRDSLDGSGGGDGVVDVAIIGAGPAGLSAALQAMEYGLSFVCVEQEDVGGTILTYPRRKVVMTQEMVIPLYGRVKRGEILKEELLDLWNEIIARTGLEVRVMEKLETITGEAGDFRLATTRGEYRARRVLLAIGRRGTPRKLNVGGERSSKVAYRLIEPEQYRESRVLVVGGGDSAVEAALAVGEQEGTEVTLSYRGEVFTRIKDRNRERLEEAVDAGRIRPLLQSQVREIRETEVELEARDGGITIGNDYVLIFVGGILPTPFLRQIGIEVRTKYGEA
jgi:thioredoxin reductase/Pyruvate/2-oxoacid:ferredoxin oxidoreductase delta subunit